MCKKFWSENLKVRDHSEDLGVDGRIVLERILEKQGGKLWTDFIWLGIGTSGGLSWTLMKLRVPWKAGNSLNVWVIVSFSRRRRTLLHGVSLFFQRVLQMTGYDLDDLTSNPRRCTCHYLHHHVHIGTEAHFHVAVWPMGSWRSSPMSEAARAWRWSLWSIGCRG